MLKSKLGFLESASQWGQLTLKLESPWQAQNPGAARRTLLRLLEPITQSPLL